MVITSDLQQQYLIESIIKLTQDLCLFVLTVCCLAEGKCLGSKPDNPSHHLTSVLKSS